MKLVAYIIYGIGVSFAITWLLGIRLYTKSGRGVQIQTVNTTMLFIVSLILIPLFKLSPFHLLWMYPASWLLGVLSLTFPFSFLSFFGNIVGKIICIGLNKKEIEIKKTRMEKMYELMRKENISPEEAKEKLKAAGEW